jgi:hypothetical protein
MHLCVWNAEAGNMWKVHHKDAPFVQRETFVLCILKILFPCKVSEALFSASAMWLGSQTLHAEEATFGLKIDIAATSTQDTALSPQTAHSACLVLCMTQGKRSALLDLFLNLKVFE